MGESRGRGELNIMDDREKLLESMAKVMEHSRKAFEGLANVPGAEKVSVKFGDTEIVLKDNKNG